MAARAMSTSWSWGENLEPVVKLSDSQSTGSLHGAHGGYDVDLAGDEGDLDELLCDVCAKLLRDPRLTLCCGKHYCETCLHQWLEKQDSVNSCPQCRSSPLEHVADKSKKRKIISIHVHCLHKDDGCTWEGELGSIETHLDSGTGCDYVPISCPNHCDSLLTRHSISVHLTSECELRPFSCEHCGYSSDYRTIIAHYEVCEAYPVDCPKGCEKLVKRRNLAAHKYECAMEEMECPFARYGCYAPIKRKDLEDHLKQETHEHLSLFMDCFQKMKSSFDTLSTNVNELCAQQIEERRRLQELEGRLTSVQGRLQEMREYQESTWYRTLVGFIVLLLWLIYVTV